MKKTMLLSFIWMLINTFNYAQTITTIAGIPQWAGYSGNSGPATSAELNSPEDMAVDAMGNIFIPDYNNNVIREVNYSSGFITVVAGNNVQGYTGDGGPATSAEITNPVAVAVDAQGNVFLVDLSYNTVREVNYSTGNIITIAGIPSLTGGYNGDNQPASSAMLGHPFGVAVDGSGNVFIADQNSLIRRVDHSTGIITSVAGYVYPITNQPTGGYSGDGGPATSAEILDPYAVKVDASGNIFFTNFEGTIRKVNTSGIITTIAGNNSYGAGYNGDGGPATSAELGAYLGVTVDALDNIFIADINNNVIREVNYSTGIISTVVGSYPGNGGYGGDGGPATSALLNFPWKVTVDGSGNLYIADRDNSVIRKVTSIATGIDELTNSSEVNIYPNPNTGEMTVKLSGNGYSFLKLFDVFGREVYTQLLDAKQTNLQFTINAGNLSNGVYFMQIVNPGGNISKRVVIEK